MSWQTLVTTRRPTFLEVAVLLAAPGEEGGNRRRVYALVAAYPGLHQRDIGRRLGFSGSAAEHHLRHLERAGLVTRQVEGAFVRYFVRVQGVTAAPGAVGEADKAKLAALRKPRLLQIVAHLLVRGAQPMGEVARALQVAPANLTHHVGKLEAVGLVTRTAQGRERFVGLADRDDAFRILLAHEPPADLVAGFEDLWGEVGV